MTDGTRTHTYTWREETVIQILARPSQLEVPHVVKLFLAFQTNACPFFFTETASRPYFPGLLIRRRF